MLTDVLVICLALGTWFALGYPVARKLGPAVVWPAVAALPLGLAILGTLTVALYAAGLRIELVFRVCLALGVPGLVLAARDALRSSLQGSQIAVAITFAIAVL